VVVTFTKTACRKIAADELTDANPGTEIQATDTTSRGPAVDKVVAISAVLRAARDADEVTDAMPVELMEAELETS